MSSTVFDRSQIKKQLNQLGYSNVPEEVVSEFWNDLKKDPLFQLKQTSGNSPIHYNTENKKNNFQEIGEGGSTFGIPRQPIVLDDNGRQTNIYELKHPNIVNTSRTQGSDFGNYNIPSYDPPLVMNDSQSNERMGFPDGVRYIDVDRVNNTSFRQTQNRRPTTARSSTRSGRRSVNRSRPSTSHGRRVRKKKKKGIRTKKSWKSHPRYGRKHDPVNRFNQFENEWKNSKFLKGIGSKRKKLRYKVKQEMLAIAHRGRT